MDAGVAARFAAYPFGGAVGGDGTT